MTSISGKIWGKTELLLKNPFVEFHKITINAGAYCSLHKHNYKHNCFYVIKGELEIEVHKNNYALVDITILSAGQMTTVAPGEFHRFHALTDVVAFELYYPETLSEDIVRKDVGGISEL